MPRRRSSSRSPGNNASPVSPGWPPNWPAADLIYLFSSPRDLPDPRRRTGMDSEAARDVARNNAPPNVAAGIVVIWGTLAADVVVLDVRHCLLFGQICLIDLAYAPA